MPSLPAMAVWERTAWICAATQFFTLVGFGLGLPFLPMYVQALGVTERAEVAVWSGVLSGSAALTMAVVAPIWGVLADRYGRKPMLVRAMLGGAVLVGAMGFVDNVWQLLGLRLLQGAITGSQAAAAALVAAATPASHAGFALGLISTAVQVGNTFGPALGAVSVDSLGFRGSFALGGLILLVGALMAIFWVDEPASQPRRPAARRRHLGAHVRAIRLARLQGPAAAAVGHVVCVLSFGEPVADLSPGHGPPELAVGRAGVRPVDYGDGDHRRARHALPRSVDGSARPARTAHRLTGGHGGRPRHPGAGADSGSVPGLAGGPRRMAGRCHGDHERDHQLWAAVGREGAAFGATGSAGGLGWGLGPILGSGVVAVGGIPALYLVSAALMLGLVVVAARSRSSSMIRVMTTAALPRPSSQR